MRESRSYGSVRGALSNERPYREFPRDFKGGNPVVQPSNDVDGAAHGIGEKQFYPPSAIQNPQ